MLAAVLSTQDLLCMADGNKAPMPERVDHFMCSDERVTRAGVQRGRDRGDSHGQQGADAECLHHKGL